ncbi:permease-like cell division protein FtsX [Amphibacillus xylanus]|uniref:Cell division protein FtsX n=1 Tax=Amphibacillus xylanus (strain ATCC 51415 / DSM 6626 / JCM 7361 / LMG 17667 / NBRC 15112 / Ep01) TaxID=698758 RepID=K0IWQ9_AMPXN|nr:permease-like cell division protein FtsX [Amphibacillus xylanus]BAM46804.1 cell division protein FtsX [Amphibacillus xylanus NBRC 15112]
MKIRTLKRHVLEGLKSSWRNSWMTLASVGAVTTTLLLVSVFLALMMNLNHVAANIEEDVQIKVLIDVTATDEEISELGQSIESLNRVASVEFSSRDQELEDLISSMGDEGDAFSLLDEDENPLNDAYIVKAFEPQDTIELAEEIETMNRVEKVNYGQGVVENIFKFNNYARNIGLILIVALLFTAIFLISNTVKITIIARRREIEIMKLVGATNWFIRWPFFIEGLLLGVLGSIIPITLLFTGYYFLDKNADVVNQFEFITILPFNPFVWQLSGIVLLIGAVIGVWGSVMSVRKFLKV